MIRLSLHELLFVYTGVCLAVVLVASIIHNLHRRRRENEALLGVVKCHLCAFEFRDETDAEFPECPACHARSNRDMISRL